jgi:hypothetical protein
MIGEAAGFPLRAEGGHVDDHAAGSLTAIVTAVFFGTWIVLGIASVVASWTMRAATKRRWMPIYVVLIGVLFLGFSTTLMYLGSRSLASLGMLFVMVPAIVLISYLNIKLTKFCDACDATLFSSNWFMPMKFCPRCGAPLDAVKPSHEADLLE